MGLFRKTIAKPHSTKAKKRDRKQHRARNNSQSQEQSFQTAIRKSGICLSWS